jgi:hypothetical protein
MDRLIVMPSVVKRVPPAIIGIGVLLCLDAALIAFGWTAASEVSLSDDPIAEGSGTLPDLDTLPSSTGHARVPEQNDPVLARPIFFPSRKPFEPPPQAVAPPPAAPKIRPPDPVFVVDGIMLTGGAGKAHLRQPREVDGRWHEMGQVVDGWTIVQIDAAGIVLEQADWRVAIRLYSSDSRGFRMIRQSSRRTAQ